MTDSNIRQTINAILNDTVKAPSTDGWSAEVREAVKLDMIDQLVHAGITGDHKAAMADVFYENGVRLDFDEDFPTFFYNSFLPRLRTIEDNRKESTVKAKIQPEIEKIRAFIANYDKADEGGTLSVEALKEAAPDVLRMATTIHDAVSPKGFDATAILKPNTRESIVEQIKNKPEAIETTYPINDDKLRFQTGAFSVIAAPTGHGKTTFLINILLDVAEKYPDKRHWLFSYEEDSAAIHIKALNAYNDRHISKNNKKTIEAHYKGDMSAFDSGLPETWNYFHANERKFWQMVEAGRINIVPADFSFDDLLTSIRTVSSDNCGMVMIDYLQLLYMSDNKGFQRTEELKQICLQLKDAAIETGLAIVGAGQFTREVISPSAMISQRLSDASDIEKAANKIIGLWNGDKRPKTAVKELKSMGVGKKMMLLRVLKARDEASDVEEVFPWDGNRGVVRPEPVPVEVRDRVRAQTNDEQPKARQMQADNVALGEKGLFPNINDSFDIEGWKK